METMDDDASADEALEIEQVDESEFVGRLGGFLGERCAFSLRFYRDGTLDGFARQPKKQQLRGLALLSTSRKRKLPSEPHDADDGDSTVVCGYLQGRWMRRGDGHAGHFQAMKRPGHVDRQTLQCRAEFFNDGSAAGTWKLSGEKAKVKKEVVDEEETESEEEEEGDCVIENVFEWKPAVGTATGGDRGHDGKNATVEASKDPLAVYPLAPGTYHFKGFITYHVPEVPRQGRARQKKKEAAPPRDECFVTMELLPDGTLVGKSREVQYPQNCPIRGTWEVGRLRYVLEFKVREAVGFFKYSARVSDPSEKDGGEHAARTLKGKWRNIDESEASTPGYTGGRGQFELVCVHRSNAVPSEDSCKAENGELVVKASKGDDDIVSILDHFHGVFTTGRYVLKGKAMDDDGYEYESQLEMELFDDGKVKGTCRELVYQQIQYLRGTWTRTTIQYELEYVVKNEVGRYWYKGRLEDDGFVLHGAWCNMELLLDNMRPDQAASYRGEKGTFSYAILESTRRWSHLSHSDFPKAFRERVRCILLCSQRTHILPSQLWGKIFAFCSHEWFQGGLATMKQEVKAE